MYKIFPSRRNKILDVMGIPQLRLRGAKRYKEFWALKSIDFELPAGSRIGILGRNGAGKSTLLKLITGNIPATEGTIEVNGKVQALLEAGAGFHPEFTGHENIHAALTYQGLTNSQIDSAVQDIVAFTELGDYLTQPFRTYSSGMQARLAFATATAIKPEILIIDEMLGAGDAYFLSKSADRIRQLVTGGASVLLVSHALDHIVKFCDQAIWIERGKIVCRGTSLEVIKEYERYIRILDDERLRAKNRLVRGRGLPISIDDEARDVLRFQLTASRGLRCDVTEMALINRDAAGANVRIGDAQDVDTSHMAYVSLVDGHWSEPRETNGVLYRSLTDSTMESVSAMVICHNLHLYTDEPYRCRISYRTHGHGHLSLTLWWDGIIHGQYELAPQPGGWGMQEVDLPRFERKAQCGGDPANDIPPVSRDLGSADDNCAVSRWPGLGLLKIEAVRLLNENGMEQAVFASETPMVVRLSFVAKQAGSYEVIPVAVLYRLDGVLVSTHIGKADELCLNQGEVRWASLDYGPIRLGNGSYVFSVALYRRLSSVDSCEIYDLLDRSYEFAVVGNPPLENGLIRNSATWTIQ